MDRDATLNLDRTTSGGWPDDPGCYPPLRKFTSSGHLFRVITFILDGTGFLTPSAYLRPKRPKTHPTAKETNPTDTTTYIDEETRSLVAPFGSPVVGGPPLGKQKVPRRFRVEPPPGGGSPTPLLGGSVVR